MATQAAASRGGMLSVQSIGHTVFLGVPADPVSPTAILRGCRGGKGCARGSGLRALGVVATAIATGDPESPRGMCTGTSRENPFTLRGYGISDNGRHWG
jgi:hypothetical protein